MALKQWVTLYSGKAAGVGSEVNSIEDEKKRRRADRGGRR